MEDTGSGCWTYVDLNLTNQWWSERINSEHSELETIKRRFIAKEDNGQDTKYPHYRNTKSRRTAMNQHPISATPTCLHLTSSNFTRSEESYDTRFTTHSSTFSRGYFPVRLEWLRLPRSRPKCELHIWMKCPRLSSKSWRNRAKSDSPILWILLHISGIEAFKVNNILTPDHIFETRHLLEPGGGHQFQTSWQNSASFSLYSVCCAVWFVAGHNHCLPFWPSGKPPPSSQRNLSHPHMGVAVVFWLLLSSSTFSPAVPYISVPIHHGDLLAALKYSVPWCSMLWKK